ncbi:MAG TPA: LysM domain-containing protein [Sphingomonas sp.]|uniref:LysM peptidoglycan-binding domain-containing protein n=1 Tax=Sphingomonas sp. TaxID=28214 RepID=UPI002ED97490
MLLACGLSACGGGGKVTLPAPPSVPIALSTPPPAPAILVATPGLSAAQRTALIYDLLNAGRADQARIEILRLMSDYPDNKVAADLLQQVQADAKTLYGSDSFAYEVKPGETFPILASRYLGAGSRFYGLARYNGIAVPSSLQPGQTIMIPGRPRAPAVIREPRRPRPPRGGIAPGTAEGTPPPAAEAPRADPARAARLRRAGLEQMAAGSIGRAVGLLQRAAALDPANAAIAADLDRARRIQSTVNSRQ